MRYVITGATSFLGLELTDILLRHGQEVIAVCRPGSKGLTSLPAGVEVVTAEMTEYGDLHRKIERADVFVHLAWGGTGHDGRDIVDVQNENVACTLAAMSASDRMGCRLFVEAGSQAEYGSTPNPQRTDMECHPFSEYGRAKLRVQQELFRLSEQLGIKYIHLRIFSLIGENDHPWTLVMSSVDKMLRREPVDLSPCTQNWNFLYVRDAVRQISALCEHAIRTEDFRHEVYNIASDDTRPLREFVEEMRTRTATTSVLNYGAIVPQNIVSLQPDMTRTRQVVGVLNTHSFGEVIDRIIRKYTHA